MFLCVLNRLINLVTWRNGVLTFYLEDENKEKSIVVLGYTELGEWIEHQEKLS